MNSYKDQLLTVEDASPLDRAPEMGPGALLKKKREELGLSFEQIAQTTKIRPHILQALEEEDWETLPSSAFVRGFIRSYAGSLGLNENMMADAYQKISGNINVPSGTGRKTVRGKKGKTLYIFSALILLAGLFFLFTNGEQIWEEISKTARDAVTGVATDSQPRRIEVVSAGKNGFSDGDHSAAPIKPAVSTKDNVSPESSEVEIVETEVEQPVVPPVDTGETALPPKTVSLPEETIITAEETVQPTLETVSEPAAASNVPPDKGLVLKANVIERTWIRVFIDNLDPKDFVFHPGSKHEWTAEKGFELLIGNAGGIELGFEGAPMKTPGKKGQVVRLRIPKGYERSKNN